jgi:hypothetical protein
MKQTLITFDLPLIYLSRTKLLFFSVKKRSWGSSSTARFQPENSGILQSDYIECRSCGVRPNASAARKFWCVARERDKSSDVLDPSRRRQHRGRPKGMLLYEPDCLTRQVSSRAQFAIRALVDCNRLTRQVSSRAHGIVQRRHSSGINISILWGSRGVRFRGAIPGHQPLLNAWRSLSGAQRQSG